MKTEGARSWAEVAADVLASPSSSVYRHTGRDEGGLLGALGALLNKCSTQKQHEISIF